MFKWKVIMFSMEVMRIANEKWEKVVKDLHFVPSAQIGKSFLFFGCKPKKKKHLIFIRALTV